MVRPLMNQAKIAIVMGSASDYATLRHAELTLAELQIAFETLVISAHRTPDRLFDFAQGAAARGFSLIIAGAGGAAHLPGMVAAKTLLPVLGVPIKSEPLLGIDSLLSIVQMPKGIPVATLAIGEAGAVNAALFAAALLALSDQALHARLTLYRERQTQAVPLTPSV